MKYVKTDILNNSVSENSLQLIADSEKQYHTQVEELCDLIRQRRSTHPIVLISGPSGSGKTTTAFEVSKMMKKKYNKKCNVISLDNYFRSNSSPDMPRDEKGNLDLESPLCTDLELLQKHLILMKQKKEFQMPVFDFKTQSRSHYVPFCREKGSVVIMEGIHALNPLVTGETEDFATCAYISVRTRIKSENGKLLHPRLIRLLRRLCRDSLFRGRRIEDIFRYFDSVSAGEDKYIIPFKHRADYQFDTFIGYEVPVYRKLLDERLRACSESFEGNERYNNIIDFFNELLPLDKENVPESSLIREFIG
ncbi:MAG: uridine kinase [Porcipelethomonas sp.]